MTRKTKAKAAASGAPPAPALPPERMCPIEELIPYARNARTHSDAQVAQIAASIREFGWTIPILVDGENGIIAGHGRLLAARKLGLKEVPVRELAHLTPAQKKAYIIADNKLALNAGWDFELLREDLNELDAENFNLALTGFEGKELEDLMTWAPGDKDKGKGKGEGESGPTEQWHVLIECEGEGQQAELLERLTEEGYKCKALVA